MTQKLHPKCYYGEADLYVDAQGNLIPCCWVATEIDHVTRTMLPETHRDLFDKFNLNGIVLQDVLDGTEWKAFLNTLHNPEKAFRNCSKICKHKGDLSGRSISTTLRKTHNVPSNTIHVELTSRCTLACLKCARTIHKDKYTITDLSLGVVATIAAQKDYPHIMLCGGLGDPIYHREFHAALRIMLSMGKTVHIVTCGSNRSQKWWDETAAICNKYPGKVSFGFSIDGLEDTNPLYRINSNWDSIMMGIDTVSKSAVAKLFWKFIVFSHNQHQLDEAKKIAEDRGMIFNVVHSNRYSGEDDPLRPDEKYVNTA